MHGMVVMSACGTVTYGCTSLTGASRQERRLCQRTRGREVNSFTEVIVPFLGCLSPRASSQCCSNVYTV